MKALRLYRKCGSVTKTIRILGYPSRESMYLWIRNSEYMNPRDRIDKRPPHKCHLSIAEKEYAVKRCFYDGESVKSVSEELGCSNTSLYLWRDKYLRGGTVSLMENNRKILIKQMYPKCPSLRRKQVLRNSCGGDCPKTHSRNKVQ